MVTVDCGAVSHEPFEVASQLGLDVIVFDHHQAPEVLPKTAALVDPNREDDLSGLGYLCAAGVRLHGARGAQPRVARGRLLERRQRPGSARLPSISSRSRRSLTSCRSSGSTALLSSRALRSCGSAAVPGLPLCSTSPAPTGRRGPIIWASSSARASTPGAASATRRSARRLLTATDDIEARDDRRRTRPAEPPPPADRDRGAGGGRSGSAARRSASRSEARRWWSRERHGRLASSACSRRGSRKGSSARPSR